ncbi:hypothetical protein ACHQM5_002123 [Ranunculus cassubicifolius]
MEMVTSSISNVSLSPGYPFFLEKFGHLTRYGYKCPPTNLAFPLKNFLFARPASLKISWRAHTTTVADGNETSSTTDDSGKPNVKGGRPLRKSKMPPVKTEDIIPGAIFTGKVRAIKPFGAFVDIGAFTEGLIHISNLSSSYVTDVKNIVSIGQEVKVKVVEASVEAGRISLSMRENDDTNDLQPTKESSADNSENNQLSKESSSPSNRDNKPLSKESSPGNRDNKPLSVKVKKVSKLVKGQEVDGTVKSLTRGGSIVTLPKGEEGFLPRSEEFAEDIPENVMGGSLLEVGQEVGLRVLNIVKGRVTLTMKKNEDGKELEPEIIHVGVVHEATNPFVLAFLKNKEIAKFLEQRKTIDG